MVALNGNVRLVALQFWFTNPDEIPLAVRYWVQEAPRSYFESHPSGVMVINPTTNCSLVEFLRELEAAGFELVDAFHREYPNNEKNSKEQRECHMVRFLFARHEFAELSDEFKKARDAIRAALSEMCRAAMWRLQMHSEFYKSMDIEEMEIPDQRVVSINLEARQPFFRPDGKPVTVWSKDANGKRVGDAPLPLKADHCLRVVGDAVSLMTA